MDAETNLKKRIIAARKNVRKKFLMLKLNAADTNADVRKVMQPIIEPLEKMSKNMSAAAVAAAAAPRPIPSTPQSASRRRPPASSTPLPTSRLGTFLQNLPTQTSVLSPSSPPPPSPSSPPSTLLHTAIAPSDESSAGEAAAAFNGNFTFASETSLLRQVKDLMNKSGDVEYDITYGPNVVEGNLLMGASKMNIDEQTSDIYINGERFKSTPGLYELIFLKRPTNFTNIDRRMYTHILNLTNVAREGFSSTGRIKSNRSYKYTHIIKPILNPRLGKGMKYLQYTGKPVEFKYWNDPNELVDRLVLLHASAKAGNTSCGSEIVALEEELRECHIIY